jgi:hypothetical protein
MRLTIRFIVLLVAFCSVVAPFREFSVSGDGVEGKSREIERPCAPLLGSEQGPAAASDPHVDRFTNL